MKVLIVCSGNSGQISPFILEQVESIKKLGVEFEYFSILGKGISGYFQNIRPLKQKLRSFSPDIIHAHYGLSGFLSMLVKGSYPLITTFHGNDINPLHPSVKIKPNWNKYLSYLVYLYSNSSIFVTLDLANQIPARAAKYEIIPCQVNLKKFLPSDKTFARKKMNLFTSKKYILFSSSFDTYIKNYKLARKACSKYENLELIELKGYKRDEVNLLLNACDVALLTSYNEGSNQFLKEAMACNRPVVSTRVGDSEWVFGITEGCYLTSFDTADVAEKIKLALKFDQECSQTNGRERIIELGLDSETIGRRVYEVYKKVLTAR